MANNEPIRHHFIPQFILHFFGFDKLHIHLYDKQQGKVIDREIREVFMERHLYRDNRHHSDKPTQIESDLGEFEREMAPVVKRFALDEDIVITKEEEERLKLFFSIMGFRARSVSASYSNNIKLPTQMIFGGYLQDEKYIDLWRRNLGALAKCRSFEEVRSHESIDDPVKLFVMRDIYGFRGTYFSVIESDEFEEFVLGDVYPTQVRIGKLPMYDLLPVSPRRVILLCYDKVMNTVPKQERVLSKMAYFQHPKEDAETGAWHIHIRKADTKDLNVINKMVFDAAEEGVVFKNKTASLRELVGEII